MTPSPLLAHHAAGEGPPLILLNGGLMSIAAWAEIAPPLEASFRVVRCDFRGQLLSPGPPPPTLEEHADDVAALLDALGLERVHAVGTSFGAEVGLLLAARNPHRVASVTAISATDRVSPEMWEEGAPLRRACRAAAEGRGDPGRVFDLLVPATFSPAWAAAQGELLDARRHQVAALPGSYFAGLLALLEALYGLDLRPLLGRIHHPALVVAAELDATFPPEHSRALAAALPDARLETVAGSGHAAVVERPTEVVERLLRFLHRTGAS